MKLLQIVMDPVAERDFSAISDTFEFLPFSRIKSIFTFSPAVWKLLWKKENEPRIVKVEASRFKIRSSGFLYDFPPRSYNSLKYRHEFFIRYMNTILRLIVDREFWNFVYLFHTCFKITTNSVRLFLLSLKLVHAFCNIIYIVFV